MWHQDFEKKNLTKTIFHWLIQENVEQKPDVTFLSETGDIRGIYFVAVTTETNLFLK